MLYAVSVQLIPRSPEFRTRLTDCSIASQRPDGTEIVRHEACTHRNGAVRWTETCYCSTPLRHERATVRTVISPELRQSSSTSLRPLTGVPLMDRLATR
jgi:hypothetical protein